MAQGLIQAPSRCWARAAVISRFTWGISSLPHGLHRTAHNMAAGFLQSKQVRRGEQNGNHSLSVPGSHYLSHILFIRNESLDPTHTQGQGITQGMDTHGGIMGPSYRPFVTCDTTSGSFLFHHNPVLLLQQLSAPCADADKVDIMGTSPLSSTVKKVDIWSQAHKEDAELQAQMHHQQGTPFPFSSCLELSWCTECVGW